VTRFPYSCKKARQDLRTLLTLLRRERVLAEDAYQTQLDAFIEICHQCEKELSARHCRGWRISINVDQALVFAPTKYKARTVRPLLHGISDFRRPSSGTSEDWEAAPLAYSTVVVLVFEGVQVTVPSERHHLDLASVDQPGPVWHLQLGGNPSGYDKFETSWLAPPRWALPPADLVLVAEALLLNFYQDAFQTLNRDGDWVRLVQSAEDLVMTHYRRHMERHFQRGPRRDSTWLMAQDNRLRALNPRPTEP
jgi:hypothetical protein